MGIARRVSPDNGHRRLPSQAIVSHKTMLRTTVGAPKAVDQPMDPETSVGFADPSTSGRRRPGPTSAFFLRSGRDFPPGQVVDALGAPAREFVAWCGGENRLLPLAEQVGLGPSGELSVHGAEVDLAEMADDLSAVTVGLCDAS
ncbi:hypothetical protein ACFWBX_37020 [Streptomyces sp. NPDC059991]|uniref:hypothetical protein n=1 Tax=Streptomyces sp. NPDC059991 TaxID=3347028 RepID=UPI0036C72C8B